MAGTKNGRVLTAKQLPESAYQTIHKLPFGTRQEVLKKLIALTVPYAKSHGPNWYLKVLEGRVYLDHG